MYEVLIQRLENAAGGPEGIKMAHDAADAIAALQSENAEKDKEIKRLTKKATLNAFIKYAMKRACEELVDTESALSRVEAERDAAKRCIYDIETYLTLGSAQYIGRVIQAWKSGAQGEG